MQVQKDDIRSRVLAAARRQFGRKGYSGTSMREIAASAGVGVGNIYNYFTSKNDLFREVVRPVLCALEAMLQEHHGIRGEDIMAMRSEKYLESCIDEYVSLIDRHRGLMEILLLRAQGSSLEHFREDYTDRSTEVVKAWFASMQLYRPFHGGGQGVVCVHAAEASGNKHGGVGLHHPPAYGMDVHYVRGTADAFGAAAGNGVHTARLHIV